MTPRTDAALEKLRAKTEAAKRLVPCYGCPARAEQQAAERKLVELSQEGHMLRMMEALAHIDQDEDLCLGCQADVEAALNPLADAILGAEEATPDA